MRQILCNSGGALVARMPRPSLRSGCVLVRVHHSLISTGTEIAALRPPEADKEATRIEKVVANTSLACHYLKLIFFTFE